MEQPRPCRILFQVLFSILLTLLIQAGPLARSCPAEEVNSLTIGLIHQGVVHKAPEKNKATLFTLARQAAGKGAKLILATELALSGYSFSSRADVAPFTETDQGKTLKEAAGLAKELQVFLGITFPEKDPATGSFYNSAAILDPGGRLVCKYRKRHGERKWSRPGSPFQKDFFDTPWGRVGVAICADSYFDLIPRSLALKGTDLLWVPANWPSGKTSPLDIWQARALENGIWLAACNRTGKDKTMDCTRAVSAVIDPMGRPILAKESKESAVFLAQIPLNKNGRFANTRRREILGQRDIGLYRQIYLDPWTKDLTRYYRLPQPGPLQIHCFVPGPGPFRFNDLEEAVKKEKSKVPALWVLPPLGPEALGPLEQMAKSRNLAFALNLEAPGKKRRSLLVTAKGRTSFASQDPSHEFPFERIHFGPAALAMVPMTALRHPELAVVLSKLGTDLVLVSETDLAGPDLALLRVRSLNSIALAACSTGQARITVAMGHHADMTTHGHSGPGTSSFLLDTAKTREKEFQYRVDFDLFLKTLPPKPEPE